MEIVYGIAIGLIGGGLAAYFFAPKGISDEDRKKMDEELARLAEEVRESADAEMRLELEALTEKIEEEAKQSRGDLKRREAKLRKEESELDKRNEQARRQEKSLGRREKDLGRRERKLTGKEEALGELKEQHKERLESIAGLSQSEARNVLIAEIEEDARRVSIDKVRTIESEAESLAEERARMIVSAAIQRFASEYVSDRTVSAVSLPSEDVKGRIIGREGRNIRAFEAATGCDVIIDESPDTVMVSSFNPVRRHVAQVAMERLLADGRIHPARIEEVAARVRKEVDQMVKRKGEEAALELEIAGLHPELVKAMGRLHFVTSFAQNVLRHSMEVGALAGLMADELGVKRKPIVRAGFLHEIGMAVEHGVEGDVAEVGAALCRKHGESKVVVQAIAASRDPDKQNTVTAQLVAAAKTLSASRPGARRDSLSSYIKRLGEIEGLASEFEGVERCYAIQAGQELRVMVDNARLSDRDADLLSRNIARKIEKEMSYTGDIKVNVVRSVRAVAYAR